MKKLASFALISFSNTNKLILTQFATMSNISVALGTILFILYKYTWYKSVFMMENVRNFIFTVTSSLFELVVKLFYNVVLFFHACKGISAVLMKLETPQRIYFSYDSLLSRRMVIFARMGE